MTNLVAQYPMVSQFDGVHSAYRCGFFTIALQKAAAPWGHTPALGVAEVTTLAHDLYVQYEGPDTASNKEGISKDQWYSVLKQEHISYEPTGTDEHSIIAELNLRRAVCVTIDETSVYDLDVDGHVPYAWTPSGTHIITIAGAEPGVWLVLDTANVGERGLRPWPRRYKIDELKINLATAIVFPWSASPKHIASAKTYTVVSGDNLSHIGVEFKTSASQLYNWNETTIEAAAKAHGYHSSNNGNLIFAGTTLRVSQ